LYVILINYKCDSPNSPTIHAFTLNQWWRMNDYQSNDWKFLGINQKFFPIDDQECFIFQFNNQNIFVDLGDWKFVITQKTWWTFNLTWQPTQNGHITSLLATLFSMYEWFLNLANKFLSFSFFHHQNVFRVCFTILCKIDPI